MKSPVRIAVTGSAGYLGRGLVRRLLAGAHLEHVVGLDIEDGPAIDDERYCFARHDVRRPCSAILAEHHIDAVVHLAFCFTPARNRRRVRAVNVGGTRQVLDSSLRAGVRTLLYCSSGTAYGALPSNRRPLREDDPLRAGPAFPYAFDKRLTDEMWQEVARRHPHRRIIICRPPVVLGPGVDNYLSRMLDKPFLFLARDPPCPMQFIHEADVADGLAVLLERATGGAYNLAPHQTITLPEMARLFGRRLVRLPARLLYPLTRATFALGLPRLNEVPAGFLDYTRFPWVLDPSRVEGELGWHCRYGSVRVVEAWHRALARANTRCLPACRPRGAASS